MRTKLVLASAAVALSAVAASAGGLDPVIIETPVEIIEPIAAAPSSSSGGSLLPVLLGVGLVAAIIAADNSDDEDE